jgi:hypothetical protein
LEFYLPQVSALYASLHLCSGILQYFTALMLAGISINYLGQIGGFECADPLLFRCIGI